MNEEKIDRIIELLVEIRDAIKGVESECSSIQFETSYTSNIKSVADDILVEVKKLTEK